MGGLLIFISMVMGTAAFISLIRPLPRLWLPTRKRAAIVWIASFVLLGIGGALSPNPKPEELAMQEQGTAERGRGQEQARQAKAVSWTAHNYQVVENEDISAPRRERRRIRILAPTAVTREDRVATAMDAAIQEHRKTQPDFVVVFLELVPFEFGNVVAQVDYAPDGCGVAGDNCTGEIWSDVRAAEGLPTPEQLEIWKAWVRHEENFREGEHELVNEERLREFLAKNFNTTPDRIQDQMIAVLTVQQTQNVELPGQQKNKGMLTNKEKRLAEKATERRNGFHCLSAWNGQHRGLVEKIEPYLRDPGSFEHIETTIAPVTADGTHSLLMRFRSRNAFGGMAPTRVWARVNSETCTAEVTKAVDESTNQVVNLGQ